MLQAQGTARVKAGSEEAWCVGDWIWDTGSRVGDRREIQEGGNICTPKVNSS